MIKHRTFRSLFIGLDVEVPLLDGSYRRYVNLDNAASTPPLKHVFDTVNRFMPYYSSVHRGTGYKSQVSTHAYDESREIVLDFVGANRREHVCIFGKNTTEAVNKLARRFQFRGKKPVVLVSTQEHHSNDLPWRMVADVVHIAITPEGALDENDFDWKLKEYGDRVELVSITGASNVTGFINPIHRLAAKTHTAGAQICVDCAQLAPHRAISMRNLDDPEHLDYITLSAHKMYAPYGTGALVGRRDTFAQGIPDMQGGGEVEIVTLKDVTWSEPPERDEAGSPNTVGAVAMAAAIKQLSAIGMDQVAQHEAVLTEHALKRLMEIDGLTLYGSKDPTAASNRLGVIPMNLDGLSHYYVAAILGYEFGIGVRNGCFCAHPYLLQLMHVNDQDAELVRQQIVSGDRREVPGLVRMSFGLYNEIDDVDTFVEALARIRRGDIKGTYRQDPASGYYLPDHWQINPRDTFNMDVPPPGR